MAKKIKKFLTIIFSLFYTPMLLCSTHCKSVIRTRDLVFKSGLYLSDFGRYCIEFKLESLILAQSER